MKIKKLFGLFFLLLLLAQCSSKPHIVQRTWHQEKGYRWAKLQTPRQVKTGFKELSSGRTGITFQNRLTKKDITKNQILLNGSGVAAGDINGDGMPDLYFTQLDGPNKLYLNEGDFHFKDVTKSAGVGLPGYKCTGTVLADVNGDGKLDLLVTTYEHGTILFLNDGNGHFTWDHHSGLDSTTVGGSTMSLADIDGDGDLDLYVAHYNDQTVRDLYTPAELEGSHVAIRQGNRYKIKKKFQKYYTNIISVSGPTLREVGTKDELYLNKGGIGKDWKGFEKVKNMKAHFLNAKGKPEGVGKNWGLSARFQDINGDGRPDLYVCNDYWTPDQFWINQGNDVFKKIDPLNVRHTPLSSMSVAIGDVNNDGHNDLFVSDMLSPLHTRRLHQIKNMDPFPVHVGEIDNQPQYNKNCLYINRGDNTFTETADYSGIDATGWSWAGTFVDVNLDGRQDLIINDGYSYDALDQDTHARLEHRNQQAPFDLQRYLKGILLYPPLKLVNWAFENDGGLKFSDKSKAWGFKQKDISQGLALADLNGDGALDMVTNRLNQNAGVYENTIGKPRIAVRLVGRSPNTQAIGARVVLRGDSVLQDKQVVSGGNYLSGSAPQLMFAACKSHADRTLIIDWPDGKTSRIDSIRANRIYKVDESTIESQKPAGNRTDSSHTVFDDVSNRLHFSEHEDDYKDYMRQRFIPVKMSQMEPGAAWLDYNNDGRPDLFETSGKGGQLSIFKNEGHGRFTRVKIPGIKGAQNGDQSAVIGWHSRKGTYLVVGSSNYEQSSPDGPSAYVYLVRHGRVVKTQQIPGTNSSTGPLAAADYNRDGTVDLFVGGLVIPGNYPKSASSALYKNEDGHFVPDQSNTNLLKHIGMVTGAVFTDYNGDGWPDLLISTAWGSLKLFKNNHGQFQDVTKQVGLDKYKGWWNGVATGDFNGDGRPDIVATNWGTNSRYHLVAGHPMRMYYANLGADSHLDIIQANYDTTMKAYVPIRQLNFYSGFMPMFTHLHSYRDYAQSSLRHILGPVLEMIPYKQINTLESMVFINEGGRKFVAHPLPRAAQLTADFDASVGDYNNDGKEDIFLSQNFFDLPPGDVRLDGGRGLWLQGDGRGNFTAVPGQRSGVKVYGEQRGAALGDYNGDGRVDLVVTQNGNRTKLFLNHTPKRGLRIQLIGPGSNENAIGSSIRLVYKNGQEGPRRELQAGSGYWSQNSFTQVMGTDGVPVQIKVRWFDGSHKTVKIPEGKKNFVIRY